MAFNAGGSGESTSSAVHQSRNNAASSPLSKPSQVRRRRSKGTISGFVHGKGNPSSPEQDKSTGEVGNSESVPNSSAGQAAQPQHARAEGSVAVMKPCYSARLALLCCQNAIQMGARTQLGLCPPGRARRNLQAAIRTRHRANRKSASKGSGGSDFGGYYGLEKLIGTQALQDMGNQEEDFLLSANTFDVESDEEASSGDEDELDDFEIILADKSSTSFDDDVKYENLREPLFTPAGADSSLSNPSGTPLSGSAGSGKLPFNQRKIRYFDSATSVQRSSARQYLRQEVEKAKRVDRIRLFKHLARMQRKERRRASQGEVENEEAELSDENEAPAVDEFGEGVGIFQDAVTTSMAAALVIESFLLNPVESLEGMAKCYDGIVAAGLAILEIADGTTVGVGEKPRPSRTEILQALTPLLITSLEKPSGEVLLLLSKLRRMCGTPRYQRRFVQRIAPNLIRPQRGALWCLRHQNDMEPILAAAELIFDSAHKIFSKGWYERGQQLLADSVRTETLNSAAQQLRNLSSDPEEGRGLALSNVGHGMRRHAKFLKTGSQMKDVGRASEPLAEWEVIAVDRQIRISIANIVSREWVRVAVPPREPEAVSRTRRGGSVNQLGRSRAAEASSKPMTSPRSPARPKVTKSLSSPPTRHQVPPPPPAETNDSSYDQSSLQEELYSPSTQANFIHSESLPASVTKTPPRSPSSPPNVPSMPSLGQGRTEARSPPPIRPESPASLSLRSGSAASAPDRAPLSPTSVGNSSVGSDYAHASSRPVSSGSSVASAASNSSSQHPAHYRMLTSTATERKRTVAACRALRSQIQRFEEAFMRLHGRPPKGAAERAPLATTYAQYREWKRAIRADAACRIQALFRGARTRWMLLRSNNPKVLHVVRNQAGRSSRQRLRDQRTLQKLSLPPDFGNSSELMISRQISVARAGDLSDPYGVSPQANSSGTTGSNSHRWATESQGRRRAGGDISDPYASSSSAFASSSQVSTQSSAELTHLSLAELQARKRDLKQKLKQYDMDFMRQHGRMPVKAEKEPIRHLYETYNALKGQITLMEQEGTQMQSAGMQQPRSQSPSSSALQSRARLKASVVPVLSSGPDSSGSDEANTGPSIARPKSRRPPSDAPSTPTGAPTSQDLAALKAEKSKLHQMLRSYEKDFFKEHRRQVSSFQDIRPVASQYRRYKDIKKAIAALQQQGGGGNQK